MDYDKLIHCLKCCARVDAQNTGCDDCGLEYCGEECQQLCGTAATAIETIRADLTRVTAERDAAISDVEALMWFSGEGCRICAHAVEVHKEPYVRLDCDREKGTDCCPKWRGIKED